MSLGEYILSRSLRALVLYLGIIIFAFFLMVVPLLSIGASLMCLVESDLILRHTLVDMMFHQDIKDWAIVPHPDVAEFINMLWRHVMNCLSGDYGHSSLTRRLVSQDLGERVVNSALLIGGSLFSSLIIGSALVARQEGETRGKDSVVGRITTQVSNSTPTFWLGMVVLFGGSYALQEILGFGFPEFGTISYDIWEVSVTSGSGAIIVAIDVLFHLLLPMSVLTISGSAIIYSTLKSNLTENLTQRSLIRYLAKGKGTEYIFYSSLKNSLHVIKEWLPAFMSTLILVEVVFVWRGVGRFLFDALLLMDYPVIRGCIITLSLFVILTHLIIDVAFNIMVRFETDLNSLERCELQSMDYNRYFIEKCR